MKRVTLILKALNSDIPKSITAMCFLFCFSKLVSRSLKPNGMCRPKKQSVLTTTTENTVIYFRSCI